jgi:hypothetical protein
MPKDFEATDSGFGEKVYEISWGIILLGLLCWAISNSRLVKLWGGEPNPVVFHIAIAIFLILALFKTIGDDGGIGDI